MDPQRVIGAACAADCDAMRDSEQVLLSLAQSARSRTLFPSEMPTTGDREAGGRASESTNEPGPNQSRLVLQLATAEDDESIKQWSLTESQDSMRSYSLCNVDRKVSAVGRIASATDSQVSRGLLRARVFPRDRLLSGEDSVQTSPSKAASRENRRSRATVKIGTRAQG